MGLEDGDVNVTCNPLHPLPHLQSPPIKELVLNFYICFPGLTLSESEEKF